MHFCAAHLYDPARARYQDFDPFWEFVTGPLHAGSFPPNALDDTFGPQQRFVKGPSSPNQPPSAGRQFAGEVHIDADSEQMTVRIFDLAGRRPLRGDAAAVARGLPKPPLAPSGSLRVRRRARAWPHPPIRG